LYLDPDRTPRTDAARGTRSRFFQFVLNSAGALYDAKGTDAKWNAEGIRCAAQVAEGQWQVELAIPFKAIETTPPKDGARWGANVCLHSASKGRLLGTWGPVKSAFREMENFGELVFTSSGPVASLERIDALVSGHGEIVVGLHGPGLAVFEMALWRPDKEEKPMLTVQKLPTRRWTLPLTLREPGPQEGAAHYQGELKVSKDGALLLFLPFKTLMAPKITFNLSAYVQDKKLEAEVIAGPSLVSPQDHSCRVTIAPRAGKPTKTVDVPRLSAAQPATVAFAKEDIPGKDVTIGLTVFDKTAKIVFEQQRELLDPFNPWWLHDETGAQEVIPPPYQPLQVAGDAIQPWGRAYRFGPCLAPAEVQTAGASILSDPIGLRATVGGKRLEWTGAPPKLIEQRPDRVRLAGQAECGAFRLSGTALVEYDGMIRVDLALIPVGEPFVDELTLEIPLKPEHAEYLYHFPGKWGTVANAGALPPDGFKHAFKPYVWLGDNDRGFAWFCESAQNWLPEDRDDAITVEREKDRVVLRLHLVRGQKIASPLRYTFGFEATPVKQPEKTVWDYRISHGGNYGIQNLPAQALSRVQYPAQGNIRGDRGTAEMWIVPPFDSDPAKAKSNDRSIPNVTFFWLDVDPKTNCGLFWCGPAQTARIWVRVDDKVLTTLEAPVTWKRGEWHHVAFSWGDELKVYIDGQLRASKPYKGLMPRDLANAVLSLGKSGSPLMVDEVRVSDIPRAPELGKQPYAPDEHALLLDHLDLDVKNRLEEKTRPVVAAGGPGTVVSSLGTEEGKHGKALRLRSEEGKYSVLDQLADYGVRTLCFHSQWSWMGYPMPIPGQEKDLRELVRACHAKGIQLLLYASPLSADEAPEWELYHKDYLISPLQWPYRYREGHVAPACCWQSHYKNLWLARQAHLIDEYDIDGFYLDGSEWPLWCQNPHHGCGYVRTDGKIGQTCNIFATREYMKRLYVLCKTRKPNAQINIHNSTVMVIPTLGWGTSSWDGEQLGSLSWDKGGLVEKRQYALDVLPLDAFRAEFMGRQWGVPSETLCYERPYTTAQLLSITLLHHVLVRPNNTYLPAISAIWRLYDNFGMKEATWYPYWSNGDVFKTNSEQLKVSAYRHPQNGLLLLVSNLSVNEVAAQVQFECEKLGLKSEGLKARDAISNEPITLTGRQVSFAMEPFSWRYVWIQ
jgi:hypothetical protein